MAFVAFDSDVSGSGSATWSAAGILFVSCDLTVLGENPRPVDDADHVVRAGWFTLGDSFDIGLGTFDYWDAPIYVDLVHTRWLPQPSGDQGGTFFTVLASRIRWHFAPGVTAHLHVFAF
jgi:hypothetical protein